MQDQEQLKDLVIGFIGVGTISSAMVKGICNATNEGGSICKSVIVSPRNEQKTKQLENTYKLVTRVESNQEVIDKSNWIVIGLLTTQIPEVLKDLKFREEQTIINLAAMPNEKFSECVKGTNKIVRACPLPPVALNVGATIVSPPHKGVEGLFDYLGSSVAVQTSHETYSLQGIACLMGPQYSIFEACYKWMVEKQKIDPAIAQKYIIGTYHSICVDALDKVTKQNHTFTDLVNEQTPGGLNEANLKKLGDKGVYDAFQQVLDETYAKMTKK